MTAPEATQSTDSTQATGAAAFVSPVDKPIGVAVLGMGNVGSEVVRILLEHATDLTARVGAPLILRGVAVRDLDKDRGIDPELFTYIFCWYAIVPSEHDDLDATLMKHFNCFRC